MRQKKKLTVVGPPKTKMNNFYKLEDSYAYVYSHQLKSYTSKKYYGKRYLPWNRPIVKISHKKRVIYRMVYSYSKLKLNKDEIYLTPVNLHILGLNIGDEIQIKKGNRFLYYWQHIDHVTRVSFKLGFIIGIISILLGITGVAISILK